MLETWIKKETWYRNSMIFIAITLIFYWSIQHIMRLFNVGTSSTVIVASLLGALFLGWLTTDQIIDWINKDSNKSIS